MREITTKLDLMKYITKVVEEYSPKCKDSIVRNSHMNNLNNLTIQDTIEAILVDFVNYIGNHQGLDWGLYTEHLHK